MEDSRREFLKRSGCALGMAALATQMRHFGMMEAMAQKAIDADRGIEGGENYKALVLVFWSGGNDGNNIVVPNHNDATISNYATYANIRNASGLAVCTRRSDRSPAASTTAFTSYGHSKRWRSSPTAARSFARCCVRSI
jgi:uncharacterized protein (DUF1501 family)